MRFTLISLALLALAARVAAGPIDIAPDWVTEWKPVYGQVETRDRVPARTRIGGTVAVLEVTEGDLVAAGQRVAVIEDPKLNFQIDALDARLEAMASRLSTARADLERGQELFERGVTTSQRLQELQTGVSVIEGEIAMLEAERFAVERQIDEGEVLAPEAGIVLSVPVSLTSVVVSGEAVAVIGGGGVYLRLAIPERHAGDLAEGDRIEIGGAGDARIGTLVKLYPQIEGGRVQADVEVEGLDARFVGRRVPVLLPVGQRRAILVPDAALTRSAGLDFVTVATADGPLRRAVVPGGSVDREGTVWREILSGLAAGDVVVAPDE